MEKIRFVATSTAPREPTASAHARGGAIGGAAGVDETNGTGTYNSSYDVDDAHYDRMNDTVSSGGRTIAVEDSVPHDVVAAAAARPGGEFVQ